MKALFLGYSGCSTCKKAQKWLREHGVDFEDRAIVEAPPTLAELKKWISQSGLPIQKWLNTSGQSYRALGKEKIQAASEATLREWLSKDGKLVKRPVLVHGDAVLVGFDEAKYRALLA
ncbi:MAG: Spx/MgsR family RNA polymerase-binding regulatory protein [Myxococcaceae bacterium]|nr:Spx/MgsR family RNA polymerase-binding regulatory protein [Myxococcaceae bacterium]